MDEGKKRDPGWDKRATILSVIGLSFVWPFFGANYFEMFLLSQIGSWGSAVVLYVLFCIVCLAVCLASIKSAAAGAVPPKAAKAMPLALGYGGTIGCLLLLAVGRYDIVSDGNAVAAVVLWALSFVSLVALWTGRLRSMPVGQALFVLATSFALNFLVGLVMTLCGDKIEELVTSLGCAISATAWRLCPRQDQAACDDLSPFRAVGRKRMYRRIAFAALFLVIASLATGYLFSRGSLGYSFEEKLIYNTALALEGVFLALIARDLDKAPARFMVLGIVGVALFGLGIFFMIVLPERLILPACTIISGVKALMCYMLWVSAVFLMKQGEFDGMRIFGAFIGTVLAVGLIGYCGAILLVKFLNVGDELMLGTVLVLLSAVGIWALVRDFSYTVVEPSTEESPAEDQPKERPMSEREACALVVEQFELSPRELDVMELLVHGYTHKRMAEELYISKNTVKYHIQNIYDKTGRHKKDDLIALVEQVRKGTQELQEP